MVSSARVWPALRAAAASVVFGSVFVAGQAFAQTDPAAARALFSEGRKLMAAKKYEQACPRFEESQRLDPGIGAMYNLADCWDHSGRIASAWAMFLDTAASARAVGQGDRERAAKERALAIESKVPHLTIQVPSADAGLEVKRDGEVVRAASYGVPLPVDPGNHHIEVSAPGKKPYATDANIAIAASLTVEIPKLESAEPASAPPDASPKNGDAHATSTVDAGTAPTKSKVLPYALVGLGVAGLAVGTVFELKSRSANGDALDICKDGEPCSLGDIGRHDSLVSDAKTDRTIAIVGLGVGALSLAGGVLLLATGQPATEKPSASAWRGAFHGRSSGRRGNRRRAASDEPIGSNQSRGSWRRSRSSSWHVRSTAESCT
jgi:hypothetical protein